AHHELMAGLPPLAAGGLARRNRSALKEADPEVIKAIQARRNLQALAEVPPNGLVNGDKLLAQIKPALEKLPDQQAAPAAFAIANQYPRQGQWGLARETLLLLVERYPAHPLAADACRWLTRPDTRSEARRRHGLKRFVGQT